MDLCLCVVGINTPDTALYESLKLLCSLLVTLVGKGLYGTNGSSSDVRFVDQGTLVARGPMFMENLIKRILVLTLPIITIALSFPLSCSINRR